MKLIGLSGPAGVGKDTVAEALKDIWAFESFSFSDGLYKEVSEAFKVGISVLQHREHKEIKIPDLALDNCSDNAFIELAMRLLDQESGLYLAAPQFMSLSPRWVLQRWGTEYRRKKDPDYWVKKAKDHIDAFFAGLIVERDPNGVPISWKDHAGLVNTSVRFANEASMIREMGGEVWHIMRPGHPRSADNGYVSEMGVPVETGDRILVNNGTVEELRTSVGLVLQGNQIVSVGAPQLFLTCPPVPRVVANARKVIEVSQNLVDGDTIEMVIGGTN